VNDRADTNHLLEAMEALVNPVRTKVLQDGPIGSGLAGQRTVTIELPSLLGQLNNAVHESMGVGGSASLPWERNILDADALYRFIRISTTIKDWARMKDARVVSDDPALTLRSWYVEYTKYPTEDGRDKFYINQMRGWASQIKTKLNPARIRDLPDACPQDDCGAKVWFNPADKMPYMRPLIVTYHEIGPNLIQEAKASCRACGMEWGVRELAYALEQAETAKKAAEEDAA
jgi:hypothetical protein